MRKERTHRMGAGGFCVCPKCGERIPHRSGVRCQDERCPDCGSKMLREGSEHHQLLEQRRAEMKKGSER
jgi:hypothetical protein